LHSCCGICHAWRLGLRVASVHEAGTAPLPAAALALAALAGAAILPLSGRALYAGLAGTWRRVRDAGGGTWPAASRAPTLAIVSDVLPGTQGQLPRVIADRGGGAFLKRSDVAKAAGWANAAQHACVRSTAFRPASAWLHARPTSTNLELADFIANARFRLGLAQAGQGAPMPPCSCGSRAWAWTMPWCVRT
jgi:hypothetical protein